MSVINQHGRQWALWALVEVNAANAVGNTFQVILPPGALLDIIYCDTTTAFNGTTGTLTVADGTTTFVAAVDVNTVGRESVTNIGKFYPNGATLTITPALTGTATAGESLTSIAYVVVGRANEVQAQ